MEPGVSKGIRASGSDYRQQTDHDFERFYLAEYPLQVRRAYLFLGSTDDAQEIVQDAFIEMLRRWDVIGEPGPYLDRIVVNRCRDLYRRRKRKARILPLLRPDAPIAESDPLWDALDQLPFRQRVAVVLRYYGDLSTTEIAERLDAPAGSVGPWISRGLQTLRRSLDE